MVLIEVNASNFNMLKSLLFFLTANDTIQATMSIQLRVIIEEHEMHKLVLPFGILNTAENLLSVIVETFQL